MSKKKAIVIGATSGIGRELALELSKKGYLIGVAGRRTKLLQTLAQSSPDSFVKKDFDVTKEDAIYELENLVKELNGLDLLVFSAGTGDLNENLNLDIVHNTNVLNVIAFSKITSWAFNFFQNQKHGHLVNISSVGGFRGSRIAPSYNASKAYQINYIEGLRQKANKLNLDIAVTDIRPGFVNTDMAKGDSQFWLASPKKAAKQICLAIQKRNDKAYITKRWRLIAIILKILPNWVYKRL